MKRLCQQDPVTSVCVDVVQKPLLLLALLFICWVLRVRSKSAKIKVINRQASAIRSLAQRSRDNRKNISIDGPPSKKIVIFRILTYRLVVVRWRLLLSGDVEVNPGPLTQEMKEILATVDDTTFNEEDWNDVIRECCSLSAKWRELSGYLGLRQSDIDTIACDNAKVSDCWNQALSRWIKHNYNTERFGEPSWRTLLKAIALVDKRLFKHLADEHQGTSLDNRGKKRVMDEKIDTTKVQGASFEAKKLKLEHEREHTPPRDIQGEKIMLGVKPRLTFPMLDRQKMTSEEKEKLEQRLYEESSLIMSRFQELFSTTIISLKERRVTATELSNHLGCFGSLKPTFKDSYHGYFRCELQKAKSVDDIMGLVFQYSSFFNYHMLEHIINYLGSEQDKRNLAKYIEEFAEYAKRKVFEYPCEVGTMNEKGYANMFVTLDEAYDNCTILSLNNFKTELKKILNIPPDVEIPLCRIEPGSIKLTLQIPHSERQRVFPLSDEEREAVCNSSSDEDSDNEDGQSMITDTGEINVKKVVKSGQITDPDRLFNDLSVVICEKYIEIGIELGLAGKVLINELDTGKFTMQQERRKALKMLQLWRVSVSEDECTYSVLAAALEKHGFHQCAHQYCYKAAEPVYHSDWKMDTPKQFRQDTTYVFAATPTTTLVTQQHTRVKVMPSESKTEIPQQSASFQKARTIAKIPFLHHQVLECDSSGQEFYIMKHDITVKVPKGAVSEGEKLYLEVGVAMYGPFKFTDDSQPISPILWLCFLNKNVKVNKPIEINVPHFLTGLTESRLQEHRVSFAKANHLNYSSQDDYIMYNFEPSEDKTQFISRKDKSYGVLEISHCCFYCIHAEKTPLLAKDAAYCLTRVERIHVWPRGNEIHFVATYFLDTCCMALEEQYPIEDGYNIISYKKFKFMECKALPLRITVPEDNHKYIIEMDPLSAEILASDIDFWGKEFSDMLLEHKKKIYPPRVKMEVISKINDPLTIVMKFSGSIYDRQLDVKLAFPLRDVKKIQKRKGDPIPEAEETSRKMPKSLKSGPIEDHDRLFTNLAADIGDKYMQIGTELGLSHQRLCNELETVPFLMLPGVSKAMKMLHFWHKSTTDSEDDFPYSKLAAALEKHGLERCAHKYCYYTTPAATEQ